MVIPTQKVSASSRNTILNAAPDASGSSASRCAICTWKGLMGLKAEPTNAAPALIATATIALKPILRVRINSTGISGMISSCRFWTTPPTAKGTDTTGMMSRSRPCSALVSDVTPRRSAPVASTTVNAPPIRKTRKMISAASAIPRGSATMASNRFTGLGSTSS